MRLSRVLDDYFPERLHVAFATRAPWIFTAIWKLVAPFLAADTKAKVRILGKADDHLTALQEFIDFDQIPDFLGGGLPTTISDGGVSDDALEALAALDAQHAELEESQRALSVALADGLQQSHAAFHPQWGQLFKAGHQNSRWAQQVQDYACLYTSHATNFLYASGNTTFRTLSDLMPHDRAVDAPMEADA